MKVNGDTHQSEHSVGYEPLARPLTERRGSSGLPKEVENQASAYQEVKKYHRDHIGTGTKPKPDGSGFNSSTYRDYQRELLKSGGEDAISNAVQMKRSTKILYFTLLLTFTTFQNLHHIPVVHHRFKNHSTSIM